MAPSTSPPEAEPRLSARIGDACARAVCVSVLASLPAGLRVAAAGGSTADGWLVAAGVALPFVVVALLLTRASDRGFRYLTAGRSPRAVVLGLALWIGLALGPLAVLASLLKEGTHHRGLGGATFGAIGVAVVAGAALLARKLVAIGNVFLERGAPPALVAGVGAAIAAVPMLFAAAPLGGRGGGSPGEAALRAAVLDGAILLVATALAASVDLPDRARKAARRVGVPLAVVVAVTALVRVETAHAALPGVRKGGGLAATFLGVLDPPEAAPPASPDPGGP